MDRPVLGEMDPEPVLVPRSVEGAGDHSEVLLAEPKHCQVCLEPSRPGQQRGVHRASNCHIGVVDRHPLDVVDDPGSGEVEDDERRQVDETHLLPHGQVLGVLDRRPPAPVPFVGPVLDPVVVDEWGVRLVPMRALPSSGLEIDRAQLGGAGMNRGELLVSLGSPLLPGMDDPVRLVEMLGATSANVMLGAGVGVEAGDIRGVWVELGISVGHPLRHRPTCPGTFLDPDGGRRPEIPHLDRLTDEGHGVGGKGEQAVDGVLDLRSGEDVGHQLESVFQLVVEVVVGEGELGRGEAGLGDGGDVVGGVEDGTMGVGADLHGARGLPLVHEGVHVTDDGKSELLPRLLEDGDRPDIDHLVHRRGEGDGGPGHAGDPGAPHPAGDHDVLGLDAALVGDYGRDPPAIGLDAEDLGVGHGLQRSQACRPLPEDRPRPQRVDRRHGGEVTAAEQDLLVDERDALLDLRRGHQVGFHVPVLRRAHPPPELLHPLLGPGHLDPAAGDVDPHLLVLTLAVEGEHRHLFVVIDREDEVGGVAGRTAGIRQRSLVDLDDVAPAELGEMAHDRVTDDPRSDHHHAGTGRHITHV